MTTTIKVGETLTATVTDANGVPSSATYQWYADGAVILGATTKDCTLNTAQVGKVITVKAEFTDNDGYAESVISPASELVVPDKPIVDLAFNNIGIQGTANFGVGITDNLPIGMSEMEGTRTLGHENYGNYQYSDGSIMCWIPQFYYRWGGADSPYAAKYGLNSCDVKSKYDFADEAEANSAGYALHRAFYDNGEVKEGFFVDKYAASNNSGVASSIKNGNPLSISPLNNPLSALNGSPQNAVYGIIKAAKSRGVDFFPQTNFIKFALSMLSLAHGQASNSNTFCAWFDATKVSNYPKGYSTETLESPSDPEVVYQPTGFIRADSELKLGKTGSASNFAKTTHNGQKSGVADCFEGVSEYLIGLTQYDGKVYSLKTTTKVSNLTDSKTASSGAWGLAGIGNNYDLLGSGFEAFTAADPSIYRDVGVNSNQVFSNATGGLSWAASCGGIPKLDSTGIVSSSDDRGGSQLFAKSRVLDKAFINCVTLSSGWNSSYHFGRDDASDNYSLTIFRSALYI
ncbi:Ig-like domain repeat protein [Psychrobacter aquimaris]|uniref:Ig-like domain repeat protein n=1 Tax=Psychrobacter aquimaris TaxID=292733 RepID=UPI0018DFE203|nr:Ig-like domain repeat protein [Psychrobacter aquimaris]